MLRLVGLPVPRPRRAERSRDVSVAAPRSPQRAPQPPEGHLLLETIRSHEAHPEDGHVPAGRRVVLVHPSDLESLGLEETDLVDLVIELGDGERRAPGFRVVSYPTAKGCAATYFPQPDGLVPAQDQDGAVIVRLERSDA